VGQLARAKKTKNDLYLHGIRLVRNGSYECILHNLLDLL
jgi:predicted  nucleic acid-binding Zn-ribbon protein